MPRGHSGASAAAPGPGASTDNEVPELGASLPSQKIPPGKAKKTPAAASLNYTSPETQTQPWVCLPLRVRRKRVIGWLSSA